MEWLWFVISGLVGAGVAAAGMAVIWSRRRNTNPHPTSHWPTVLVPMLIGEGSRPDLPKAALVAASGLAQDGKVVFDLFIEVPRSQSLSAQLPAETEISLQLIEAAEEEARRQECRFETSIQKVRDYGYGVVEVARQVGATAVVLETAIVQHSPSQRGELGSSVRQPNTSALTMLIHDRAGCDVLIVG